MLTTANRVFVPDHMPPHGNEYIHPEKRQRFDHQALSSMQPSACGQSVMHYSPTKCKMWPVWGYKLHGLCVHSRSV